MVIWFVVKIMQVMNKQYRIGLWCEQLDIVGGEIK